MLRDQCQKYFSLTCPRRPATWVFFKYERLLGFHYWCGCLGHIQQACPILQTHQEMITFYPWLRVENTNITRLISFKDQQTMSSS